MSESAAANKKATQLEQLSTVAVEQAAAAAPAAPAATDASSTRQADNHNQCWTPAYIGIPVVDEQETAIRGEEVLVEINFAELIGSGPRSAKNNVMAKRYLSSELSYNSLAFRKLKLAPLFQKACEKAGFRVVMKGWEENRQMIRFACQKSRMYTGKMPADGEKVQTGRSMTKICPFNFSVHWEKGIRANTGRWYVCACGIGKNSHEGHGETTYVEEPPTFAPHDIAFQQFMPQYQQFCILASSDNMKLMDTAGKLLQNDIEQLHVRQAPKKKKRGRKSKKDKETDKFESLQGVPWPYVSLPPSSLPPRPVKRVYVEKAPKPSPKKRGAKPAATTTSKKRATTAAATTKTASKKKKPYVPGTMAPPPRIMPVPPPMAVPRGMFMPRTTLPLAAQPFMAMPPKAMPVPPPAPVPFNPLVPHIALTPMQRAQLEALRLPSHLKAAAKQDDDKKSAAKKDDDKKKAAEENNDDKKKKEVDLTALTPMQRAQMEKLPKKDDNKEKAAKENNDDKNKESDNDGKKGDDKETTVPSEK